MKIKIETLEELLGEVETKDQFKIILPFLRKISELEEKNEALEETKKELGQFEGTEVINKELRRENSNLLEKLHELETKIDILNDENEVLAQNNEGIQNKISKLRNIFKSIEKGIPIETLYEKIEEIGILIDSDLSEQIELIKTINENFREGQNEINTLKYDKERIGILLAQFQKENERKDNIIKSMEKNSTDLLMSNEDLRERIKNFEERNRELSGELLNQTEEIHMLEEEIDRLKSENERLNNQIIDLQRLNRELQEDIFRRNEND